MEKNYVKEEENEVKINVNVCELCYKIMKYLGILVAAFLVRVLGFTTIFPQK